MTASYTTTYYIRNYTMTENPQQTDNEIEASETIETLNISIIKYNVTDAALAEIEERLAIANIPTDLTKKENYAIVKNAVSETRTLRGKVDAKRKDLKKPALEFGRKVESEAKKILERLLVIEEPIKKLKNDFDTKVEIEKRETARKEEERVDRISSQIADIRAMVGAHVSSLAVTIEDVLDNLNANKPEEWADEFVDKAREAVEESKSKLLELYDMKVQSEEAASKAREEARKREIDDKAHKAEQEKKFAAEQAKLAEEQAKLAEEQTKFEAERAEITAKEEEKRREEQAKIAAEQKAKFEKERAAAEEEKKREAEKENKAQEEKAKKMDDQWTAKAVDQITTIISQVKNGDSKVEAVVKAIKAGKIDHIVWQI